MRPMPELSIEEVPTDSLVAYANNAKLHSNEQVEQICNSIEEFGFNDPIAVWDNPQGETEIVEGHGRVLAAKKLGMQTVPIVRLDHMTDEQRRAYTHVHNQLTLNTGLDFDKLDKDLAELDFDFYAFGFDANADFEGMNEDADLIEKVEGEQPADVPFAEYVDECSQYVVLKFRNAKDWNNAMSIFGLSDARRYSTRKDGKITGTMNAVGVGRVIDGVTAIGCIERNVRSLA